MNENGATKKRGGLLWLLVLVLVFVAWWFFRPASHTSVSVADMEADRIAGLDADPDDILVDLIDDASAAQVAAIERDLGIDLELVSDQSRDEQFYRAHVDPMRRDSILEALSRRSEVELAEPDALIFVAPEVGFTAPDTQHEGFPNDPKYKYQWHMDQIDMKGAWPLADGDGVIVAVIDTGVAFDSYQSYIPMPDLAGVQFVKPFNFVGNNKHANDDHGHGTHVAGTIAQSTHNGIGVAGIGRAVKIMPLKVLGKDGSGSVGGIADAIRYAADEGAQVINMSLGGRFPSRAMKKAVAYAHSKGVVVVCAAGNDGRGKVSYPAAYPGSIAVAATQYDETTTFYSNWGKEIDIAAPGGNTRVDQNNDGMPDGVLQNTLVDGNPGKSDYLGYMGTSMASPHVAGVAALVVGEGVTNPDHVESILKSTARKPKKGKFDKKRYGGGIVDAKEAVLKARSTFGAWQLGLGLLLAGAIAGSVRRRGMLGIKLGPGYLAGVAMGASGLFFLPYLGGIASLPVLETLSRGVPSWDLAVLGPAGHGNGLFFSALIPFGLIAALYGVRRLRAPLAGLAIGVGAHLLFHAAVRLTDIQWIPSAGVADQLWLVANAAICGFIAAVVMKR